MDRIPFIAELEEEAFREKPQRRADFHKGTPANVCLNSEGPLNKKTEASTLASDFEKLTALGGVGYTLSPGIFSTALLVVLMLFILIGILLALLTQKRI